MQTFSHGYFVATVAYQAFADQRPKDFNVTFPVFLLVPYGQPEKETHERVKELVSAELLKRHPVKFGYIADGAEHFDDEDINFHVHSMEILNAEKPIVDSNFEIAVLK